MKKFLLIGAVLITVAFFFFAKENDNQKVGTNNKGVLSGESQSEDELTLCINENCYQTYFLEVSPINIHLFPNLEERLTAKEALEKNRCEALVSGGFYSREEGLLGLFISEGITLSTPRQSRLLDGYFYINGGSAFIKETPPQRATTALQTGPLLIKEGRSLNVISQTEEKARRLIVATTERETVLFVTFYQEENLIRGPELGETPSLLSLLSERLGVKITNAVNLDGGSHSAFYSSQVRLTDVSTMGSYFCIR